MIKAADKMRNTEFFGATLNPKPIRKPLLEFLQIQAYNHGTLTCDSRMIW
jgi:hypothetical protein